MKFVGKVCTNCQKLFDVDPYRVPKALYNQTRFEAAVKQALAREELDESDLELPADQVSHQPRAATTTPDLVSENIGLANSQWQSDPDLRLRQFGLKVMMIEKDKLITLKRNEKRKSGDIQELAIHHNRKVSTDVWNQTQTREQKDKSNAKRTFARRALKQAGLSGDDEMAHAIKIKAGINPRKTAGASRTDEQFLAESDRWLAHLTPAQKADHEKSVNEGCARRWATLTPDQQADTMESAHDGHAIWWAALSLDEKETNRQLGTERWSSISPDEQEAHRQLGRARCATLTPAKQGADAKLDRDTWSSLSPELQAAHRQLRRDRWAAMSPDEQKAQTQLGRDWWSSLSSEEQTAHRDLRPEWWDGLTNAEKVEHMQPAHDGRRDWWDGLNAAGKARWRKNISDALVAYWEKVFKDVNNERLQGSATARYMKNELKLPSNLYSKEDMDGLLSEVVSGCDSCTIAELQEEYFTEFAAQLDPNTNPDPVTAILDFAEYVMTKTKYGASAWGMVRDLSMQVYIEMPYSASRTVFQYDRCSYGFLSDPENADMLRGLKVSPIALKQYKANADMHHPIGTFGMAKAAQSLFCSCSLNYFAEMLGVKFTLAINGNMKSSSGEAYGIMKCCGIQLSYLDFRFPKQGIMTAEHKEAAKRWKSVYSLLQAHDLPFRFIRSLRPLRVVKSQRRVGNWAAYCEGNMKYCMLKDTARFLHETVFEDDTDDMNCDDADDMDADMNEIIAHALDLLDEEREEEELDTSSQPEQASLTLPSAARSLLLAAGGGSTNESDHFDDGNSPLNKRSRRDDHPNSSKQAAGGGGLGHVGANSSSSSSSSSSNPFWKTSLPTNTSTRTIVPPRKDPPKQGNVGAKASKKANTGKRQNPAITKDNAPLQRNLLDFYGSPPAKENTPNPGDRPIRNSGNCDDPITF